MVVSSLRKSARATSNPYKSGLLLCGRLLEGYRSFYPSVTKPFRNVSLPNSNDWALKEYLQKDPLRVTAKP